MRMDKTFAFRLRQEDRDLIFSLAQQMGRSQSDVLRLLIRNAFSRFIHNSNLLSDISPIEKNIDEQLKGGVS
jgi:predicted DNA-binding protein